MKKRKDRFLELSKFLARDQQKRPIKDGKGGSKGKRRESRSIFSLSLFGEGEDQDREKTLDFQNEGKKIGKNLASVFVSACILFFALVALLSFEPADSKIYFD